MYFIEKLSAGFVAAVDIIVEKNRQAAQLNRLAAIIRTEKDIVNHAYAALGKHYLKILDKTEEVSDMTRLCEVIKYSEERLKKAQIRYDYIRTFGIPKRTMDTAEMMRLIDIREEEPVYCEPETEKEPETTEENEEPEDITIAVAEDVTVENAANDTAENDSETTVNNSDTVAKMKKSHSRRKNTSGDSQGNN